jgi:hypothetical protein
LDYKAIEKEKIARPKSSFESYKATVNESIRQFVQDNKLFTAVENGKFTLKNYHNLLKAIFHQVYFSSTSFGLAGSMLSNVSIPARSYLFHHAEEEKDHWMWILEDLQSTGYKGADPRSTFPNWASQAYLSYGIYLSLFNPLGRLAMANVLEGVSGSFGGNYGAKVVKMLGLTKENAKFFLVHGELDQGHTEDVMSVLAEENLTGEQWAEMEQIARVTSQLYKNIYNFAIEDQA